MCTSCLRRQTVSPGSHWSQFDLLVCLKLRRIKRLLCVLRKISIVSPRAYMYIASTLSGRGRVFVGYRITLPNLNRLGQNSACKWGTTTRCHIVLGSETLHLICFSVVSFVFPVLFWRRRLISTIAWFRNIFCCKILICGKSPQGFNQKAQKCFFRVGVFRAVVSMQRDLSVMHLSCTDVDNFWKNRRESVCRLWLAWKISTLLSKESEFYSPPPKKKNAKRFLSGVLVRSIEVKHHNFGRHESWAGLANTARMCLSFEETYGLGATTSWR